MAFAYDRGQRLQLALLLLFGAVFALARELNAAALSFGLSSELRAAELTLRLVLAGLFGPLVFFAFRTGARALVRRTSLSAAAKARFLRFDTFTFGVFGVFLLGALGVRLSAPVELAVLLVFIALQLLLAVLPVPGERERSTYGALAFLFLISGFAALIYQVTWQRALFVAFGVNIESITIIVSLFMFGLGVGALLGGYLSQRLATRLPLLFLLCELSIGLFGLVSLKLIDAVATATVQGNLWTISLAIYALLSVPTLLMGATLPILVAHLFEYYRHIGKAVGLLYFVNTIGSAIACFATANIIFVLVGMQAAVYVAALCNFVVGVLVFFFMLAARATPDAVPAEQSQGSAR
jgi:hypothetical protein